MNIDEKLDKIIEKQSAQAVTLGEIKVDLAHHIKRSDKHESLIQKLWFAVALLAGAGAGSAGPSLIKLLGGIL